jgi:hypothetical protein
MEIEMTYTIKMHNRMSGEWSNLWTKNPMSLEEANEKFNKFQYDSDFSNYQIVDENGIIARDWLQEKGK